MPEGILIDYNDGRPVMAITAGFVPRRFVRTSRGAAQPVIK